MQLTEGLSVYESWSSAASALSRPSRLYPLPPMHLGTAESESLTSYIARLAQAHNVTVAALFALEIAPLMKQNSFRDRLGEFRARRVVISSFPQLVRAINGIGKTATDFVRAIETLTQRSDIGLLTMKPWGSVFAKCHLLRLSHAACFSCYEEWRVQGKIICEPLLWALEAVKMCPKHDQPLSRQCSFCGQRLMALTSHSRPGYCSRCGEWLGTLTVEPPHHATATDEWKETRWWARAAGELIAAAPSLDCPPAREAISRAIRSQTHSAGVASLARLVRMNGSTAGFWQRGNTVPEFGRFLKMCFHLDVSPLQFLSHEVGPAVLPVTPRRKNTPWSNQRRRDTAKRILESALHEDPPPLVKSMAIRTGCSLRTLQKHYSSLCHALAKRRAAYIEASIHDLGSKLEAILTEQPPPSFKEIALRFGHAKGTLRKYFSDLVSALVKRFIDHRHTECLARRQRLENEIRQAALSLQRAGRYPSLQRISRCITQTDSLVGNEWACYLLKMIRNELGIRGTRQAVNFRRLER